MKLIQKGIAVLCVLGSTAVAQDHTEKFERVQQIFNKRCVHCHGGYEPAAGFSLERGQSYRNLVNVPSSENPDLAKVKPNDLRNSYLYRKVLRDRKTLPFAEDPMPLDADLLPAGELAAIEDWIRSFPANLWGGEAVTESRVPNKAETGDNEEAFLATQLINLPTTRTYGERTAEFRILHRFYIMNGGGNNTVKEFFGLDQGAITSLNLGISLRNDLDILVRRTGFDKDVEVGMKYVPFREGDLPVSIGAFVSIDWISRSDVNAENRVSPNFQILLGKKFGNTALLLVPSLSARSNHEPNTNDTRATTALGMGLQYEPLRNTAVTAEYIARVSGYKGASADPRFNTWALGLMYKIRLHVFQILISNAQRLHTSQWVPGSTEISKNSLFDKGPNFHFGFNIIRQFKW